MCSTSKQIPRIWILAILVISLMLFVAACGSRREPPPTPAPTPTPAPPTATSTPEPPTATPTPRPPTATPTPSASELIDQGMAYYEQGELEQALAAFQGAIDLEPDNADTHRDLGSVYVEQGKWAEAAAAYEQAISLKPDFGEAYGDLVSAYVRLDRLPEAIDAGEKAIKLAPKYATGYSNLGAAYKLQGQLDKAVAQYQEAIRLDPEFAMPHYNWGLIYYGQGQTEQAMAEWQEAARLDPNYADTHKNLAIIYLDLDQPAEALSQLETYLQLVPDAPDRAAVEDKIAELAAQITEPSEEAAGQSAQSDVEASLTDIDINRAPGHSIGFENRLEPGEAQRFLFLASPGDTIGASVSSSSELMVGIQDAQTGQTLAAAPSGGDPLFVTIPQNALYHIVIQDAGGKGSDYTAAFEASSKVSFALDPNYFMIGRLPEGGLLYYTYTAPGGATLRGNVIPHPDTPVDLVVTIRELESQAVLAEFNESGPSENEQFGFTVPDTGDGTLLTYIVSVEDAGKNKGAYILSIDSDTPVAVAPVTSPESVVQAIFDAATSGDFASLQALCDPLGENDGDTQMICDLATDEANRDEFVQYFAKGKVNGDAITSRDGQTAGVPFLFGPDGNSEETMELINRDGQWYLFGF